MPITLSNESLIPHQSRLTEPSFQECDIARQVMIEAHELEIAFESELLKLIEASHAMHQFPKEGPDQVRHFNEIMPVFSPHLYCEFCFQAEKLAGHAHVVGDFKTQASIVLALIGELSEARNTVNTVTWSLISTEES